MCPCHHGYATLSVLQELFSRFEKEEIPVYEMSTLTEDGIANVKTKVVQQFKIQNNAKVCICVILPC